MQSLISLGILGKCQITIWVRNIQFCEKQNIFFHFYNKIRKKSFFVRFWIVYHIFKKNKKHSLKCSFWEVLFKGFSKKFDLKFLSILLPKSFYEESLKFFCTRKLREISRGEGAKWTFFGNYHKIRTKWQKTFIKTLYNANGENARSAFSESCII